MTSLQMDQELGSKKAAYHHLIIENSQVWGWIQEFHLGYVSSEKPVKHLNRNVKYVVEHTTQEIRGRVWTGAINLEVMYAQMVFNAMVKNEIL